MNAAAVVAMPRMQDPRFIARIAGFCWLMCAITGTISLFERGTRLGLASNLAATVFYVGATVLVYVVFRAVHRGLSLFAAACSLVGCGLGIVSMAFKLGVPGYAIIFLFGLHCLLVGYLILKSTFMPRFVGALMVFAGLGWLAKSAATALAIPFGTSPYSLAPGILGEVTLAVWLLVMGVHAQRWMEQAGRTRQSRG